MKSAKPLALAVLFASAMVSSPASPALAGVWCAECYYHSQYDGAVGCQPSLDAFASALQGWYRDKPRNVPDDSGFMTWVACRDVSYTLLPPPPPGNNWRAIEYRSHMYHCPSGREEAKGSVIVGPGCELPCPIGQESYPGGCGSIKREGIGSASLRPPRMDKGGTPSGGYCPNEVGAQGPGTTVGDPVELTTGSQILLETDYRGPRPNGLLFERYYRHSPPALWSDRDQWWTHTYSRKLMTLADGSIEAWRHDGGRYHFVRGGDGQWSGGGTFNRRLEDRAEGGWRLFNDQNQVEEYDAAGRLLSITDREGRSLTLTYDADNHLAAVRDAAGAVMTFTTNAPGYVTSLTLPDGGVFRYEYNDRMMLRRVENPLGASRVYQYDNAKFVQAMTGVTDENGVQFASWSYDAKGRAVVSEQAGGTDRTTLTYNADGSTTVTNGAGLSRLYRYNSAGRITSVEESACPDCASGTTTYAYDANGLLSEVADAAGRITRYAYNDRGLQTSRVEAAGTALERTILTEWHEVLRAPTRIVEPGRTTTLSYDAAGRVTTRGQQDSATGASRSWSYAYDAAGRLASVNGPRGDVQDVLTLAYNEAGDLSTLTDALGRTTRIDARDLHGRPLALTDPNGLSVSLVYDALGRVIQSNAGGRITRFGYSPAGDLIRVERPDGVVVTLTYDGARRLVRVTDNREGQLDLTLDAVGHRVKEEVRDGSGALALARMRAYNQLGRLVRESGAAGQTTSRGYDAVGNPVAVSDPLGNASGYVFDALNRMIQSVDAAGGTTRFRYDAGDHLTGVTDPKGAETTYQYDGLGRVTAVLSPDAGTVRYVYDEADNVVERIDAQNRSTRYTYDALHRPVRALLSDGSEIVYGYDAGSNGLGHLTSLQGGGSALSWNYNAWGDVVSRLESANGKSLTTSYQFDDSGRLTGVSYPSGKTATYAYAADGRLTGLSWNGQPVLSGVTYRPLGPVSGWTWASGAAYVRQFDQDGRISAHTVGNASRVITYDAAGRITRLADGEFDGQYGYDALSRLTLAQGSENRSYLYDPNGNRVRMTEGANATDYLYGSIGSRLLSSSGADARAYQHDASGNVIHDGKFSFEYDVRGRLVSVNGGRTARYLLNALGERVYKEAAGSQKPGDVNGDGKVDHFDYAALGLLLATHRYTEAGDCNQDGKITYEDMQCVHQAVRLAKVEALEGQLTPHADCDGNGSVNEKDK
ncbi:MAG: hypothetical protein HQL51_07145, partial [Magnetococcales bacterium]|nr:hypothetical protein [Magnetococcales bacterium]